MLPWDSGWGVLKNEVYEPVSAAEKTYIDERARISSEALGAEVRKVFQEDENVKFPPNWNYSFSPSIEQLSGRSNE